jgi:hypothetical protein
MEISEFDTSYTLRIKKAFALEVPYKYILYDGENYFSLFRFIEASLEDNRSLIDMYRDADPYISNLNLKDFYMSYYLIVRESIPDETSVQNINALITDVNMDSEQNFTALQEVGQEQGTFKTVTEFFEDFQFWVANYVEEVKLNANMYERLIKSQEILEQTTPIEIKPESIIINKSKLEFKPKFINIDSEVTPEDGIEVFDQIEPSIDIPFIQYIDSLEKSYYKVFEDGSLNFDNIIPTTSQARKNNYIYLKVSVIKDIKDIKEEAETIKKNYILCEYNLIKNKLTVNVESDEKTIVVERIKKAFKNIDIGEYKETSLKGEFYVPSLAFNFANLHYLVLNDNREEDLNGVFSNYVFIDETKSSVVNRINNQMSLKYKSLEKEEEIEEEIEEEDSYSSINPSSLTLSIRQNSSSFNFLKAKNKEILYQFIKIFSRLAAIYKNYDDAISDVFSEVIPELKTFKKKEIVAELIDEKVKNLRNAAPDVFLKGTVGYSRLCSCDHQPIIVSDDAEAKDLRNKTFTDKKENEEKYRQIASFPPKKEDTIFKFTCPTDERPYPYLVENNTEENSEKYPYVPCCGKEDKLDDFFNIYYKESGEKTKSYKSYEINTIKVLEYKRTGKVPVQIQNLLSSYTIDEKYEFNRIGSVRSVNSLIHCIMIALQDINDDATFYRNLNTNNEREEFCKTIRKKMITNFPDLNVYKQELYDISTEEIKLKLENDNEFLDPALYYRGLEELYSVNIFIFTPQSDGNKDPSIEIPRHKFTHIRPNRPERDSIIVFKHGGGESEDLKYPQCELIFNSGKIKENVTEDKEDIDKKGRGRPKKQEKQKEAQATSDKSEYFFSGVMTDILYTSLERFSKSYIFSFGTKGSENELETNKVQIRLNPYSSVFYNDILKNPIKIISQFIDGYGKTRIVNIKIAQYKVSLFIPPTQPFNVPTITTNEIYKSTTDVVITIFGEPKKTTKDGLWYSIIDYEYGLFIPCITRSNVTIPEVPMLLKNISEKAENEINKYRNVKKFYDWFENLVIWGLRSNGILNLKDLSKLNKYIKIVDSLDYTIGPTMLDRRLPSDQNFSFLSTWWSNYFTRDNKVKMTPKLYDKMYKMLKRYYILTDGLSLPPAKYLENVYKYEEDFIKYFNSRLIIGSNHLEMWRKQRKSNISTESVIYKDLTKKSLLTQEEPFLYMMDSMTGESKIYLIQNIKTGTQLRASFVSRIWIEKKFNIGYIVKDEDVESISVEKPETVIYKINPSNKIVYYRQENITSKTTEYIQLLYDEVSGYYHAMLPLV